MEKKVSDYRKTEGAAFFFIEAAKALGWYREKTGIKLSDIGKQIALSESAVSKYLIAPKLEKNFSNEEDLKKNSKVILQKLVLMLTVTFLLMWTAQEKL